MTRNSLDHFQFINLASGSGRPPAMGVEPSTVEVQLTDEFTLDGRAVVLIDTPGFDGASKTVTDISKMIVAFLADT